MVEVKNKKNRTNYVYGNVAYDLEPQQQPKIEKKVKKQKKNNASRKLKLIGKLIVISVLSFLLVYRFTMVMKLTYDIRNLKTQITELKGTNENIKMEIAETNNIKVIEKLAVEKDGMIVPDSSQIKYVDVKPLTIASEKYSPSAFQMIQRLLGLIY